MRRPLLLKVLPIREDDERDLKGEVLGIWSIQPRLTLLQIRYSEVEAIVD
jgi:hypothetical protein